jgi:hypothetical protein
MIKVFLLLIMPFFLYGAKILNYNVYDRTDRVDVMLTFDTPYDGVIKENRVNSKIVLTLQNVTIESPKLKKISSKYIQKLSIVPLQNATQIIATIARGNVKLLASKTTDGYGLRLRFTAQAASKTKQTTSNTAQNSLSMLPTKKDENISTSYYIVVSILVIGIFILFYIKRRVAPYKEDKTPRKVKKVKKEAWLFESTKKNNQEMPKESDTSNVSIRFQKAIDNDNSVVMLDFGTQSYLVLMGKSNILLDKFKDNKPASQQEFESILQSRHEELESFLAASSTQNNELKETAQEPLQAYKERAATLLYSDNQ